MSHAESRLHREADRIVELAARLERAEFARPPAPPVAAALVAVACRFGGAQLLADYVQRVEPAWHNGAGVIFEEDEDTTFYVAGILPRPLRSTYLLLRGYELWITPCLSEGQVARVKAFGLAFITLGLRALTEAGATTKLEQLAREAVTHDMELRDYLPEIERLLREVLTDRPDPGKGPRRRPAARG
jgi:hypothetical protein